MIADDRPNDDKGDAKKEAREPRREGDIQIAVMAMSGGVGPQVRRFGFTHQRIGPPESHESMTEYGPFENFADRKLPYVGSAGETRI